MCVGFRYLSDQMVQRGTSTRLDLATVHEQHRRIFEESLTEAIENMEAAQKWVELHVMIFSVSIHSV